MSLMMDVPMSAMRKLWKINEKHFDYAAIAALPFLITFILILGFD
jgi:hypothetical protein